MSFGCQVGNEFIFPKDIKNNYMWLFLTFQST